MSKKAQDVTFGEAMARLESIVSQLEEDESIGLEQALALYEQGLALADDCQQRLAAAKLRLTQIAVPPLASPAAEPA
ncbi:MAG TPA: exodeoxyribonuclease VII small subunit [Chloroflexota bacterium]|nr:exodeoxyribonuclease VII small subunit [Chloroflexota bacterium]